MQFELPGESQYLVWNGARLDTIPMVNDEIEKAAQWQIKIAEDRVVRRTDKIISGKQWWECIYLKSHSVSRAICIDIERDVVHSVKVIYNMQHELLAAVIEHHDDELFVKPIIF